MYEQNNLSAVRLDFPEGYLYMRATAYNIEIQLSEKRYDPLAFPVLPRGEGKYMGVPEKKGAVTNYETV